jgi:hypothetical protein
MHSSQDIGASLDNLTLKFFNYTDIGTELSFTMPIADIQPLCNCTDQYGDTYFLVSHGTDFSDDRKSLTTSIFANKFVVGPLCMTKRPLGGICIPEKSSSNSERKSEANSVSLENIKSVPNQQQTRM